MRIKIYFFPPCNLSTRTVKNAHFKQRFIFFTICFVIMSMLYGIFRVNGWQKEYYINCNSENLFNERKKNGVFVRHQKSNEFF